jgi:hypothetical protein
MALDLSALSSQVRSMSRSLTRGPDTVLERIAQVRTIYLGYAGNENDMVTAVNLSRDANPWRALACPYERLDLVRDVPDLPAAYMVAATDGSQIERDRHGIADCYLINIGQVFLRYGYNPTARLSSYPTLFYLDDDLYLSNGARRVAIEGSYLNARRDVQELVALEELSNAVLDGSLPSLALLDGTLVRWTLAGAERFVQESFLRPYLDSLERLHQREVPVASYISRPRSTEVVGAIRLMYCPDIDIGQEPSPRCNQCSDVAQGHTPSCSVCDGLTDADVLYGHLAEGQRGPLFISMSQVNMKNYGDHMIHFFYMRVGREMARVEMPQWVAYTPALVDLVHTLIYDQCSRGQGYPVALARAHEQAVVRASDRRAFLRMVEESLWQAEAPATMSSKQESKEYSKV